MSENKQPYYRPTTRVNGRPMQVDFIDSVQYLGPRYTRERGGDFSDTTLAGRLGATAKNSLLLLPPEISGLTVEATDDPKAISFTQIDELGRGRENNVSGVEFGQLHISDEHDAPVSQLVAAKPMPRPRVPKEFHASRAINKRFGERVTFQPVGFVKSTKGNDTFSYLTRYEHDVISLDNLLWNESATEEQRTRSMAFAAMWLVALHNVGISHGDAQAKNITYDASQQPRYADLEGAHELNGPDTAVQRLADVHDFFNPTFMPPTTPEEQSVFADTYLDQQDSPRGHKLEEADIFDVIELAEDELQR